jgi:Protein of unknown function (DUF2510)
MRRIVDAARRFNDWSRHAEARHPARWSVVFPLTFVTIDAAFGQLPSPWIVAVAFYVGLAIVLSGLQMYLWRPGGMKRNRYERWLELQRDPQVYRPGEFAAGWYLDVSRRHDVRYWDGTAWTAWVADGGDAFIDDGSPENVAPRPMPGKSNRTGPAIPLLLGMVTGSLLGSGLLIAAFAFPHPMTILFGDFGSSEQLGGIWLLTAGAIVVGVAMSIGFGWRARVRLYPLESTPTTRSESKAATFRRSLGPTIGIAAIAAWPTWIQGWPAMFGLGVLAGLVAVALLAAIYMVKVSTVERREHAELRAGGVLAALRGAFAAPTAP